MRRKALRLGFLVALGAYVPTMGCVGDAAVVAPSDGGGPDSTAGPDAADAAPNEGGDAQVDAGPACALAKPFGTPTLLANVNSTGSDENPRLSTDELTMYFTSDRAGGLGAADVYVAKRGTPSGAFNAPTQVASLSSNQADESAFVTSSGLTAYVGSARNRVDGVADIYAATRANALADFGPVAGVALINSGEDDVNPFMNAQNSIMYFASSRPNYANYDLYYATLTAGAFDAPLPITELNTTSDEASPVIDATGLTLYFVSNRSGSAAHDVWMATRANTTTTFGAASNTGDVAALNSAQDDVPGWLSSDGCRMYLTSSRGGTGGSDLWLAERSK